MGHDFAKFQAMENAWETKKLVLSVLWESFGEKMPIAVP